MLPNRVVRLDGVVQVNHHLDTSLSKLCPLVGKQQFTAELYPDMDAIDVKNGHEGTGPKVPRVQGRELTFR
jgi:hypothetical protein